MASRPRQPPLIVLLGIPLTCSAASPQCVPSMGVCNQDLCPCSLPETRIFWTPTSAPMFGFLPGGQDIGLCPQLRSGGHHLYPGSPVLGLEH